MVANKGGCYACGNDKLGDNSAIGFIYSLHLNFPRKPSVHAWTYAFKIVLQDQRKPVQLILAKENLAEIVNIS